MILSGCMYSPFISSLPERIATNGSLLRNNLHDELLFVKLSLLAQSDLPLRMQQLVFWASLAP